MDTPAKKWGALIDRFARPGLGIKNFVCLLTGELPLGAGNECLLDQARTHIERVIADAQGVAAKLPALDDGFWIDLIAFLREVLAEDARIHPALKGVEK
jgi:hypothetical protein